MCTSVCTVTVNHPQPPIIKAEALLETSALIIIAIYCLDGLIDGFEGLRQARSQAAYLHGDPCDSVSHGTSSFLSAIKKAP